VPYLNGRGRKTTYEVSGNVVWLAAYPTKGRDRLSANPVASLKQSVTRLVGEIERSERLRAEIAEAIDARRYELYRRSINVGVKASNRNLAAAGRTHLGSLLKFVHALAAAGAGERGGDSGSAARLDPLSRSMRELEASLERARRLSRDMLVQCQRCDWREGSSALARPQH
jgi:hypothetical protein